MNYMNLKDFLMDNYIYIIIVIILIIITIIGFLADKKKNFESAKLEITRPFPQEEELKAKSKRLDELNIKLNLNEKDKEIVDDGGEDIRDSQVCKKDYER